MEKISVIVPIYNVEKYIEKCLTSIIKQDIKEIEIICIEDCSTDNSYEIAQNISKEHENIKLYKNDKNRGLSYCRNKGIELANGEYILFVDSDDTIQENVLAQVYGVAKCNELDMLGFKYREIKDDKVLSDEYSNSLANIKMNGLDYFKKQAENKSFYVMTWGYLYKSSFLDSNKLCFEEGLLHEDDEFFLKCMLCSPTIMMIEEYVYNYYRRDNTITTSRENAKLLERIDSICFIINSIQEVSASVEDYSIKKSLQIYQMWHLDSILLIYKKISTIPIKYEYKSFITPMILGICSKWLYDGYYPFKFSKEELDIFEGKKILIYGAGRVGKNAKQLLDDLGYNNYIVQSKKTSDNVENNALIENWVGEKETAVVLIASSKFKKELLNNAQKLGFKNIVLPTI